MLWVEWICFLIAAVSITIGVRLLWAWHKLISHPHVEPIEIAKPEISYELTQLVAEVARIANVIPPPIYIRRAALPNAFIVVGILRPELFLTDQLLEQCCNLDDLERVICHEIAHIKRTDTIPLGLLTLAKQWSQILALKCFTTYFQKLMTNIEHAADKDAEVLFNNLTATSPTNTKYSQNI